MFAQQQHDVRKDQARAEAVPGRDAPIVGHRLPGGYMVVHAPGQPCRYCDGEVAAGRRR